MIRLRHLAGDTAIYGLVSTARSLVGLLLVPIYTRVFLPGDYGRIDTLTTLVVALTLILTLGMDTAVALFFYDNSGERDRATMLTTAIASRVGLSALAAFLITFVAPLISRQLFGSEAAANAVRLAVWTAPASALVGFLIELLRLDRRPWRYSSLAVANLLLGVLLSILFVVAWRWGIDGAFAGPLAANLLVLPIGVYMSRRLLTWRLSPAWLVRLLRIGLPMVPAAFGGWIIAYANRYFLLYFTSAAAVGLLAVGNKASAPLALFTSAFRIAWTPFAFSVQKQENARAVYAKTLTHFCVISGTMAVGVGLFARELLLIFTTTQYIDGHVVAGLMAFQLIVDSSYYIVSIGLVLAKRTGALAYTVPVAAAGSILLNLALVPAFGFFGAALANTLSYCLSTLLAYIMAQRVYQVPYELSKLARLALLCVGTWALGILIAVGGLWVAVAIKMLLFVGFVAGLFVLRIVSVEEARLLLDWLRRQVPTRFASASAHLHE
jgi:O-antigen/teichoic acid export membrane protein